jgi:hypothetical protein
METFENKTPEQQSEQKSEKQSTEKKIDDKEIKTERDVIPDYLKTQYTKRNINDKCQLRQFIDAFIQYNRDNKLKPTTFQEVDKILETPKFDDFLTQYPSKEAFFQENTK